MDTTEFKELAKGKDLLKVVATFFQDSQVIVSAYLVCDQPNQLTPYNFLRDGKGEIIKFDSTQQAVTAIRMFGYRDEIVFLRDEQKVS